MGSNLNDRLQKISNCYIGIVDFSSDIGLSNFIITKDGKNILSLNIEVFPSKIDYQKDYKDIMREVNEEIYSLAFGLMGKTYLETKLVDTKYQTNAEFINILRCIFDRLEEVIKRVNQRIFKIKSIQYAKFLFKISNCPDGDWTINLVTLKRFRI